MKREQTLRSLKKENAARLSAPRPTFPTPVTTWKKSLAVAVASFATQLCAAVVCGVQALPKLKMVCPTVKPMTMARKNHRSLSMASSMSAYSMATWNRLRARGGVSPQGKEAAAHLMKKAARRCFTNPRASRRGPRCSRRAHESICTITAVANVPNTENPYVGLL